MPAPRTQRARGPPLPRLEDDNAAVSDEGGEVPSEPAGLLVRDVRAEQTAAVQLPASGGDQARVPVPEARVARPGQAVDIPRPRGINQLAVRGLGDDNPRGTPGLGEHRTMERKEVRGRHDIEVEVETERVVSRSARRPRRGGPGRLQRSWRQRPTRGTMAR